MKRLATRLLLMVCVSFLPGCSGEIPDDSPGASVPGVETAAEQYTYVRQVHPTLGNFRFTLVVRSRAGSSEKLRAIALEIREIGNTRPVQIFDLQTADVHLEKDLAGFEFIDMNFDGYGDVRLAGQLTAGPNTPYLNWLFAPDHRQFVPAPELDKITSPEFLKERKQIKSPWRDGPVRYGADYFEWVGGKPELARRELEEYLDDDSVKRTTYQRIDGEMTVVKSRTLEKPKPR